MEPGSNPLLVQTLHVFLVAVLEWTCFLPHTKPTHLLLLPWIWVLLFTCLLIWIWDHKQREKKTRSLPFCLFLFFVFYFYFCFYFSTSEDLSCYNRDSKGFTIKKKCWLWSFKWDLANAPSENLFQPSVSFLEFLIVCSYAHFQLSEHSSDSYSSLIVYIFVYTSSVKRTHWKNSGRCWGSHLECACHFKRSLPQFMEWIVSITEFPSTGKAFNSDKLCSKRNEHIAHLLRRQTIDSGKAWVWERH